MINMVQITIKFYSEHDKMLGKKVIDLPPKTDTITVVHGKKYFGGCRIW